MISMIYYSHTIPVVKVGLSAVAMLRMAVDASGVIISPPSRYTHTWLALRRAKRGVGRERVGRVEYRLVFAQYISRYTIQTHTYSYIPLVFQ